MTMDLPAETIYLGFTALIGAITLLWRRTVISANQCDERETRSTVRITELASEVSICRDRTENFLGKVVAENTASNHAVVRYLEKINRKVNDLDPKTEGDYDTDVHPTVAHGNDRQVIECHPSGETTAIIRRKGRQ